MVPLILIRGWRPTACVVGLMGCGFIVVMIMMPENNLEAATVANLGDDQWPYVIVGHCEGGCVAVFRMLEGEAIREDWRLSGERPGGRGLPYLAFDVDGDGWNDLVSGHMDERIVLWRQPDSEEADGLLGPRSLEIVRQ